MKIAISVPDDIFAEAEALAKRLGTSRSEIYSRALSQFLQRNAPDRVTEMMDKVIAEVGEPKRDDFSRRAARRALRRVEW